MKQSLQLRFSQHLALTPQLQQSIRLLQLSTLELNQEIEQMLVDNPLLERIDNPMDGMLRLDAQATPISNAPLAGGTDPNERNHNRDEGGDASSTNPTSEFERDNGTAGTEGSVAGSDSDSRDADSRGTDGGIDQGLDWGADRRNRDDDDDDRERPQGAGTRLTLEAHLLQQLSAARCSPRDAAFVHLLIGELDQNGWLSTSVEALFADLIDRLRTLQLRLLDDGDATATQNTELPALFKLLLTFAPAGWSARNAHEASALLNELLGAEDAQPNAAWQTVGELQLAEMQAGLNLLRSFDPPGVGAHDLADCLSLQLKRLPRRQWPSVDGWEAACAIAQDHLPLLAARDWTRLKKALNLKDHEEDEQTLRDAQALIRTLQPLPGQDFDGEEAAYVLPDVIVRRTKAGWTAALNPDVMPRLRVNDLYSRILRRNKGPSNLSMQLQEARWLVKNIHQRFDTILRVAQAIVERQREFFTHGEVAMRPLVLREIAEVLGLHESTISRVTTQKYMLTPTGTFELKYFFGSHVATDTGGAASSTAIRALLKQLVAAEDVRQPLSDSRLAEMLGEQGIVVARRTVAKYRESLRIPAVTQRKAL
jgi:RNA polymerase sigma-54 factor